MIILIIHIIVSYDQNISLIFMWKMDPMSEFDIRLVFTLPPRDSILQYQGRFDEHQNWGGNAEKQWSISFHFWSQMGLSVSLWTFGKFLCPWTIIQKSIWEINIESKDKLSERMFKYSTRQKRRPNGSSSRFDFTHVIVKINLFGDILEIQNFFVLLLEKF